MAKEFEKLTGVDIEEHKGISDAVVALKVTGWLHAVGEVARKHFEYWITAAEYQQLPADDLERRQAVRAIIRREVREAMKEWERGDRRTKDAQAVAKSQVRAILGGDDEMTTLANPAPPRQKTNS